MEEVSRRLLLLTALCLLPLAAVAKDACDCEDDPPVRTGSTLDLVSLRVQDRVPEGFLLSASIPWPEGHHYSLPEPSRRLESACALYRQSGANAFRLVIAWRDIEPLQEGGQNRWRWPERLHPLAGDPAIAPIIELDLAQPWADALAATALESYLDRVLEFAGHVAAEILRGHPDACFILPTPEAFGPPDWRQKGAWAERFAAWALRFAHTVKAEGEGARLILAIPNLKTTAQLEHLIVSFDYRDIRVYEFLDIPALWEEGGSALRALLSVEESLVVTGFRHLKVRLIGGWSLPPPEGNPPAGFHTALTEGWGWVNLIGKDGRQASWLGGAELRHWCDAEESADLPPRDAGVGLLDAYGRARGNAYLAFPPARPDIALEMECTRDEKRIRFHNRGAERVEYRWESAESWADGAGEGMLATGESAVITWDNSSAACKFFGNLHLVWRGETHTMRVFSR